MILNWMSKFYLFEYWISELSKMISYRSDDETSGDENAGDDEDEEDGDDEDEDEEDTEEEIDDEEDKPLEPSKAAQIKKLSVNSK